MKGCFRYITTQSGFNLPRCVCLKVKDMGPFSASSE